ncbi:hypothetical protein [Xanthomonas citri]|uniref:hypothetical protein n=1 Tax=Xanthomonas citri TaxID=346 RepID=UPI000310268B|nr:hypothetical protein [Xanthomonas citri]AMU99470.1 hypothetical protein TP37_16315 [Xanthomonas citri pv. aurantifolii]AMV03977.1 hypothetical protein TP50_17215 [Xanthomonas citri pv. aurantifolii]MCC8490611.1 hypothetical protein [Xanthomonas citri pv. fuscans]TBW93789.1 hypothetical protein TP47_20280 [Xanthomonas citri pv. aurantifolii]TBW94083.1 hypothetical protein TP49_19860 [Xanthomonas citri pv. aurantifolii]
MNRPDLLKTYRVAPGVFLQLQARNGDLHAGLYADALHDRAPVMFACSTVEDPHDVFAVDDGTGLVIGSLHVVMPEPAVADLVEWVLDRMLALEEA